MYVIMSEKAARWPVLVSYSGSRVHVGARSHDVSPRRERHLDSCCVITKLAIKAKILFIIDQRVMLRNFANLQLI